MPLEIIRAETDEHIARARELFREYEAWIETDLCFQSFEQELAGLPGKYAPPEGRLLLGIRDGQLAGCVALRKIEEGVCEMKRLFVRPEFHGQGVGRQLINRVLNEAGEIGYQRMRLDTLPPRMNNAIALYRKIGFNEIAPYYDNPVSGALFMELDLRR